MAMDFMSLRTVAYSFFIPCLPGDDAALGGLRMNSPKNRYVPAFNGWKMRKLDALAPIPSPYPLIALELLGPGPSFLISKRLDVAGTSIVSGMKRPVLMSIGSSVVLAVRWRRQYRQQRDGKRQRAAYTR